jgi:hypothetical protein
VQIMAKLWSQCISLFIAFPNIDILS